MSLTGKIWGLIKCAIISHDRRLWHTYDNPDKKYITFKAKCERCGTKFYATLTRGKRLKDINWKEEKQQQDYSHPDKNNDLPSKRRFENTQYYDCRRYNAQ